MLVWFLFTSVPRTASARLPLFGLMSINWLVEKVIIYYKTTEVADPILGAHNDVSKTKNYFKNLEYPPTHTHFSRIQKSVLTFSNLSIFFLNSSRKYISKFPYQTLYKFINY